MTDVALFRNPVLLLIKSLSSSMINADFCTGSVLISFGAVLGKTSPVQLLIMAMFEVTLFAVNEFILLSILGVSHDEDDI